MISHVTRFIDLSNQNFLVVPIIQEDELLSSWLVRIALAHDTIPWSFYNMHFPEYKNIIFSRDLDVWAPQKFLEKLAQKSNLPYQEIFNLTLQSYIGTLLPQFNPSGMNKYFSYIKVRGRSNKLYGQKYCPKCLQENTLSYFKKEWRLKYIQTCKKHNLTLQDKCPNCNKPISIYKFSKQGYGYTKCWNCYSLLYE